jgi:hypothetical protein
MTFPQSTLVPEDSSADRPSWWSDQPQVLTTGNEPFVIVDAAGKFWRIDPVVGQYRKLVAEPTTE